MRFCITQVKIELISPMFRYVNFKNTNLRRLFPRAEVRDGIKVILRRLASYRFAGV